MPILRAVVDKRYINIIVIVIYYCYVDIIYVPELWSLLRHQNLITQLQRSSVQQEQQCAELCFLSWW